MRKTLLSLALAGVALASCTLEPPYHQPGSAVPAAWPTGGPYPAASGEAELVGWKSVVTDPRLSQVVALALANNRDLRVAVADIAESRAQYHIQRAALFPAITANGSATMTGEPLAVATGGTGGGQITEHIYEATAGFSSYELDLFGRVRSLTHAAQEQYFASEQARRAAQITLISEVASDWMTLAADRQLLAIDKAMETSDDETLAVTQGRYDHGVASAVDLAEAKTSAAQAKADTAAAATQAAQDRNALELVVGASVPDDLLADALNDEPAVADTPAGANSDLLLRRPDVLEAEDDLKAENANIGAARAAFFPQITLTGDAGGASTALGTLFTGASRTWLFEPQLAMPLFEGGKNVAGLKSAKAQRDAAIATYQKAIQTAFREVADALARRGTIDDQLSAEAAASNAADQGEQLADARYQHGADSYLNLLIAQRTAYSARQSLVETRLAQGVNRITLYTALGGGWN